MILTIHPKGLSSKTSKLHLCTTCINVIRNIPSKKYIFLLYKTLRDETASLWKRTAPIETPFTSVLDILCQKPNTQRPSYRINVPPCQEIGPSSPHFLSFSLCLFLSLYLRAIRAWRGGLQLLSLLLQQLATKWQANDESFLGVAPEQCSFTACLMGEGIMNDVGQALRPPTGHKSQTPSITIWITSTSGQKHKNFPQQWKRWLDDAHSSHDSIQKHKYTKHGYVYQCTWSQKGTLPSGVPQQMLGLALIKYALLQTNARASIWCIMYVLQLFSHSLLKV